MIFFNHSNNPLLLAGLSKFVREKNDQVFLIKSYLKFQLITFLKLLLRPECFLKISDTQMRIILFPWMPVDFKCFQRKKILWYKNWILYWAFNRMSLEIVIKDLRDRMSIITT